MTQNVKLRPEYLALVVDDSNGAVRSFNGVLGSVFDVEAVGTAAAAIVRLRDEPLPDVILLTLKLPNGQGVELVQRFQASIPDIPIVVVTEVEVSAREVILAGAQDFMTKEEAGREPQRLFDAVARAMVRHQVRKQFEPLKEQVALAKQSVEKMSERLEASAAKAAQMLSVSSR